MQNSIAHFMSSLSYLSTDDRCVGGINNHVVRREWRIASVSSLELVKWNINLHLSNVVFWRAIWDKTTSNKIAF